MKGKGQGKDKGKAKGKDKGQGKDDAKGHEPSSLSTFHRVG